MRQAIATRNELDQQRDELLLKLETERAAIGQAQRLLDLSRLIERRKQERVRAAGFDQAHDLSCKAEREHKLQFDELERIKRELASSVESTY